MQAKLTLRNYRCFSNEQPAVFEIGPGFTSFIGPNNAGKSTILKFFYEIRHALNYVQGLRSGTFLGGTFSTGVAGMGGLPQPITDQSEIVNESARTPLQFEIQIDSLPGEYVQKAIWTYHSEQGAWSIDFVTSSGVLLTRSGSSPNLVGLNGSHVTMRDGQQLQFETMLDTVQAIANTQYLGPFRNAVNEGAGSYYDLQLGTAFLAQWHQWKTGGDKKMNRALAQVTEDVRRLIGVRTLEINASNELKTLQLSIDGRPHKLSELGAGIAQLIVVLGNALIRKPSFIAIDEPETHLHPALQLDFLTTLASYASCGVIYATHSIGLARATADRLYSVQAGDRGSIVRPYEKTPRYAEFLGSLGIAGLQDIGWNKVLLVEGTTDVRTFQQLLRKYDKDRQVVVFPLGGSSMIHGKAAPHLEEVVRLCNASNSVFAVIDSERKSPEQSLSKERAEFAQNCESLGIKCLVTEKRATENYLTDRCVKAVFGQEYMALDDYSVPNSSSTFWGKSENWRAAKEMTRDELDGTDLGQFLATL